MKILINSERVLPLKKEAHDLLNSNNPDFEKALMKEYNAQVIDILPMEYDCIKILTLNDFEVVEGIIQLKDENWAIKCDLHKELNELKKFLKDTDWKAIVNFELGTNKYDLTDRANARARINELEIELSIL